MEQPPRNDSSDSPLPEPPAGLVGDGLAVPCIDGSERPYVNLDFAASTSALTAVADAVAAFLPIYSSVHRGAGFKSRQATSAYESARASALAFCGDRPSDDVAILCRNTTEAINHLAYRLRLDPDDVVAHHRRRAPRQPPALGPRWPPAATWSAPPTAPSTPTTSSPASILGPSPACSP